MNKSENNLSYQELKCKQIVDVNEGRNLGHLCDMVFTSDAARVLGLIAPFGKRSIFGKGQEIFIPWKCIKNIGEDVIIVDISSLNTGHRPPEKRECDGSCQNVPPIAADASIPSPPSPETPNCDRRCDKCMLFDCQFRWKGKM